MSPNPIAQLVRRITELEDRVANLVRQGTVSEVDHEKGLVKMETGDFKSGWITWAEQAGGANTRTMPKVGQAVNSWFPNGNPEVGFATPGHDTDANPLADAEEGEHVYQRGALRISQKDDTYSITVGGVTLKVSAAGVEVTGGHVIHDGKHIDKHHTHGGVESGGSSTSVPD